MKQILSILFLLFFLFSCTENTQREQQPISQPPPTSNTPFEIKKGVECSVKVVGVTDGDTFKGLTSDNQQVKCRIYGIDAPEKKQDFGQRSKQYLSDLIFGKTVKIKIQGKSWDRAVVWCYTADGKDISAEMLCAGMAWHYKQYSNDSEYAELENAARRQKIGLWADKSPVAPWKFRKKK